MRTIFILLVVVAWVVVGCSGGSGTLKTDAAAAADTYVALNLEDGTFKAVGSDRAVVEADTRYRTTHILFRRIPGGIGQTGTESNLSQETVVETVTYAEFFCAVYETTQAQWTLLAGTTPWTSSIYAGAFSDQSLLAAPTLPAWGMSYDQAAEAAAAWSKGGWRVALPSSKQWEIACRAGAAKKLFPWGNNSGDLTIPRSQAVFWEVGGGVPLPRLVGGNRLGNAWGLFDMIGNIGELTTPELDGSVALHGGAYDQPLVVCRASNFLSLPHDLALPSTGVRLILVRE
jgi:formylglycine-generating enzyme required for sulfatase activity